MTDPRGKNMPTVPIDLVHGNALFENAVAAIGLDETTTRSLFASVLKTIGTKPLHLTPDELGNLLPEIDRRLRKLLPDAQADVAMKRLYAVLFDLAGPV